MYTGTAVLAGPPYPVPCAVCVYTVIVVKEQLT